MISKAQYPESKDPFSATLRIDGSRLPRQVFIFFLILDLALVVLDLVLNYGRLIDYGQIRRMFNIAREDGIGTWVMIIQCFLCGVTLGITFLIQQSRGIKSWKLWGYGFLSLFFIFLSMDDAAKIHERMGSIFKRVYQDVDSGSAFAWLGQLLDFFPSYAWQLAALPFLAGAGFFMLFFLLREFEPGYERKVLWLAVAYMAFAQGLDFIEGLDAANPLNVYAWFQHKYELREYTAKHSGRVVEEFLEMLSMTTFLSLFLRHLIRNSGDSIRLVFSRDNKAL